MIKLLKRKGNKKRKEKKIRKERKRKTIVIIDRFIFIIICFHDSERMKFRQSQFTDVEESKLSRNV